MSATEHRWGISPIKYLVTVNDDVLPEDTPSDRPVSYVDISNVDADRGITGCEDFVFGNAPSRARRLVRHGDVIISTVRTYLRAIARIEETRPELVVSTGFAVLRPQPTVEPRFFGYAMQSQCLIDEIVARSTGVSYPAITATDLAGLKIPFPNKKVQIAISSFLDYETAEADAVIARYEQLLKLLEEKRIAMIARAVTNGLDPNVPMKDSGVEWIGEIPAHWSMWKMSRAAAGIGSGTTPPSDRLEWYDGGIPFVTTTELREALIFETNGTVSEAAIAEFSSLKIHPTGSIVLAMYGATIGRLGILAVPATVNQACCVIQASKTLSAAYLYQWLLAMRREIVSLAFGGGQPNISQETIRSLRVPTPPIDEQTTIVSYINEKLVPMGTLREATEQAIALAKERRSALITAAVTGKIDVTTYKSDIAKDVA